MCLVNVKSWKLLQQNAALVELSGDPQLEIAFKCFFNLWMWELNLVLWVVNLDCY